MGELWAAAAGALVSTAVSSYFAPSPSGGGGGVRGPSNPGTTITNNNGTNMGGTGYRAPNFFQQGNFSGQGGIPGSTSSSFYDPFAPYRNQSAEQLNALMLNPSSIQSLPEYQADMQAATRASAAQGYTGSGNALVAAANAGGQAYQQAFNNLAILSGANQAPATGAGMAANQGNINQRDAETQQSLQQQQADFEQQEGDYYQQQQNQMFGQLGNVAGRLMNGLSSGNNRPGSGANYYNYGTYTGYGSNAFGGSTGGGGFTYGSIPPNTPPMFY